MPVDLDRIVRAVAEAVLEEQDAGPRQPTSRKPKLLTPPRALLIGAGVVTIGRVAVRSRGRNLVENLQQRLIDFENQYLANEPEGEPDEGYEDEPDGEYEGDQQDEPEGEYDDEPEGEYDDEPEAEYDDEEPEGEYEDEEPEGEYDGEPDDEEEEDEEPAHRQPRQRSRSTPGRSG
jgi:hypothetical protein